MNFKKIGIATVLGFVAMALSSAVPLMVFYEPNFAALAEKFPGIVKATPDMVPALIGGVVWMFVMAIIFDKMGTKSIKDGAITGAWLGASKWFVFDKFMVRVFTKVL